MLLPLLSALGALSAGPPPETPEPSITIAAVGDVTLAAGFERYIDKRIERGWSLDKALRYGFAKTKAILEQADVAIANCEGTFTTRGERGDGKFAFRGRPALARALALGGVDVATLANNHAMDWGAVGLLDTLKHLERVGVRAVGAGATRSEAREPLILEVNGLKLGILAYKGTSIESVDQRDPEMVEDYPHPTIAFCDFDAPCLFRMVRQDVAALTRRADLIVVAFHWGQELSYEPLAFQVALAHAAVEAGADAVIGHHPHVLQGVESYLGAPIFYSLGNFVFGGKWDPDDKDSAIAMIRLNRRGLVGVDIVPVKSTDPSRHPYQPRPLRGAERDRVLSELARRSAAFPETITALEGLARQRPAH